MKPPQLSDHSVRICLSCLELTPIPALDARFCPRDEKAAQEKSEMKRVMPLHENEAMDRVSWLEPLLLQLLALLLDSRGVGDLLN